MSGTGIKICCGCCPVFEEEEEEDTSVVTESLLGTDANESRTKKNMLRTCCSVSAGVCGVICLILGIITAFLFDPFINSIIDKELVIKNDSHSQVYKFWVDPPIVPYLRIYFFNLTNSEEFLNLKKKPIFEEVGPYSYREKWKKVNISFHKNGTVTYQTKKEYYFDRSESNGTKNDIIHTLDVPVNVAVQKISKMGRLAKLALSSMLAVLNKTAFIHKTVDEFVWGYSDPLIEMAKKYLPKEDQLPFDKFGFFYKKNGSTDGLFNVFTGAEDIRKYTIIDTFNFSRELKFWNTPECNRINGTDGTSYPPHVKKDATLYLFNENLCRSLPLTYNNTNNHTDLESYRFTPPQDVFADVSKRPENECFCVGGPPCIGGGVFNISACTFNVSSILSWPHFYQADQKYLDAVSGLKPDPLKHSLFIDVNPQLGMPLAAQARVQINFFTLNVTEVKPVANMTRMVFPVLWFEDGVDKLPPEIISLLEKSTNVPKVVKTSFLSVFFVVGIVLIALGIVGYLLQRQTNSSVFITRESSRVPIAKESHDYSPTESGHTNPVVSAENPD